MIANANSVGVIFKSILASVLALTLPSNLFPEDKSSDQIITQSPTCTLANAVALFEVYLTIFEEGLVTSIVVSAVTPVLID